MRVLILGDAALRQPEAPRITARLDQHHLAALQRDTPWTSVVLETRFLEFDTIVAAWAATKSLSVVCGCDGPDFLKTPGFAACVVTPISDGDMRRHKLHYNGRRTGLAGIEHYLYLNCPVATPQSLVETHCDMALFFTTTTDNGDFIHVTSRYAKKHGKLLEVAMVVKMRNSGW